MKLVPLIQQSEISGAYNRVVEKLKHRAKPFTRHIGWQGGNVKGEVFWLSDHKIWFLLDRHKGESRYWFLIGLQNPEDRSVLQITCEVNAPIEGVNRMCAGVFLKDDRNNIYMGHSGKIGGGRKGIGKNEFIQWRGETLDTVEWSDGKKTDSIIIGCVNSQHFNSQLASFAKQVEEFKSYTTGEIITKPKQKKSKTLFTPEFSGIRSGYKINNSIEAKCNHGVIINTLRDILLQMGKNVKRDRYRDLFIQSGKRITHLFEAKTDVSRTNIYTGIGQLIFLGMQENIPKRILVLPDLPDDMSFKVLRELGINVLTFSWKKDIPIFKNIMSLFNEVDHRQRNSH